MKFAICLIGLFVLTAHCAVIPNSLNNISIKVKYIQTLPADENPSTQTIKDTTTTTTAAPSISIKDNAIDEAQVLKQMIDKAVIVGQTQGK